SDDEEVAVGARIHGRLDAVDHFLRRNDFFARAVAAALGADLVFDVAGGRAELDQAFDGAPDVEGRRAETGVDVHHKRDIADIGDAADVGQDVVQRVDAQVGQAQRASGDATTRQINGLIARTLGQQGMVGVDGAND